MRINKTLGNATAIFYGLILIILVCNSGVEGSESRIDFTRETLDNGLQVIYAPMKNAPVVHVRVLYHVGSKDERPNRQGFAHLFEHMMFRGSRHVAPEEHMKLIGIVGGDSNAFTSFDQTTYINTVPSNNVEMTLYLEADRMASFKVNDDIFKTERKVVAEEWRMRYANQPLGSMFSDLMGTAFTTHSYRWTPIGDMEQLAQATSSELQEFFNTYYVPNNACLVIAGDIDLDQTRQWVHQYFGWIPSGAEVTRRAPQEPPQTEVRRKVVTKPNVPLTNMILAFKTPEYQHPDHDALNVLAEILSSGRTGLLDKALVNNSSPKCVSVGSGNYQLEDPSLFVINAVVKTGHKVEEVESEIIRVIDGIKQNGITEDELQKVRVQIKQSIIRNRQEARDVAAQLAEEEVFGGDASRVNTYFARLDALTPADIQRVVKQYLNPLQMTVVIYQPGESKDVSPQQTADLARKVADSDVMPSTQPIEPRVQDFPPDYPSQPPVNRQAIRVTFNKGVESDVKGVKVITLSDHRLPLVNVSLVFRAGSHTEPVGKEGLAGLAAQMMRRGSGDWSFLQLSQDLESRGISIEVTDQGDNTRLNIDCTSDQIDYAIDRANLILTNPTFPAEELENLKQQTIGSLIQTLSRPGNVASREFTSRLYSGAPQGRLPTPESLASITRDDVLNWYRKIYSLDRAFIVFSGDLTPEQGNLLAQKLLSKYDNQSPLPSIDYTPDRLPSGRQIILVDNPQGKQSAIRLGVRAYDLTNDDKFPGSLAGQILSAGIESRLGKYVRAEKGLTYGAYAYFRPTRWAGEFSGTVDTNPQTTTEAIQAMFKVFNDLREQLVTDDELSEAKLRVSGGMVMEVQTVAQQASRRIDQILNNYPIDYYDVLPQRINQVTAGQIRQVMNTYVHDDQMLIVVVAPADAVKTQLETLGPVTVIPMPLARQD
ncbi:MAG: peptidase M16 [Phycisphaerae bacterium]|mgnify:CR=1 FL=1|jgi:zinc protease|nr:MAG: peptidase M16 [Phycisphaerae bacterium]